MVVQTIDLENTERRILTLIRRGVSNPSQLIDELKELGIDEDLIRGSIWLLLDQGKLDLTWERQLIPAQTENV